MARDVESLPGQCWAPRPLEPGPFLGGAWSSACWDGCGASASRASRVLAPTLCAPVPVSGPHFPRGCPPVPSSLQPSLGAASEERGAPAAVARCQRLRGSSQTCTSLLLLRLLLSALLSSLTAVRRPYCPVCWRSQCVCWVLGDLGIVSSYLRGCFLPGPGAWPSAWASLSARAACLPACPGGGGIAGHSPLQGSLPALGAHRLTKPVWCWAVVSSTF